MYNNNSIYVDKIQVLLEKINKDFKKSYHTRKIVYDNLINNSKVEIAERLKDCGKYYTAFVSDLGNVELMNRCKQRFCPTCEKYSAIERYISLSNKIKQFDKNEEYVTYHYIFTVRNCEYEKTKATIQGLNKAVAMFYRHYKISNYTRRIELTYNENTNTFHPHIHSIAIIPKGTILDCKEEKKENFIEKLSVLRKEWHGYLIKAGVEDNSINYNLVYARPLQSVNDLLECVKYSVKPCVITKDTIQRFTSILKHLKLYSGHGIFRVTKEKEEENKEECKNIMQNYKLQFAFAREFDGYKLIKYVNKC